MSADSRQGIPYANRKLMTTMNKSGIIAQQDAQRRSKFRKFRKSPRGRSLVKYFSGI